MKPVLSVGDRFVMTDFAKGRHFDDPNFAGTRIPGSVQDFLLHLEDLVDRNEAGAANGYAPFCKHVFIAAPPNVLDPLILLTPENAHLVRSDYEARRPGEAKVLTRWIPRESVQLEPAPFLDVIVYSAEQLAKEGHAIEGDWGIVAINACRETYEAPMPPITMMRNALGVAEGGSGVPLDRAAYDAAVDFWSKYVLAR